jgi:hypothetical protein
MLKTKTEFNYRSNNSYLTDEQFDNLVSENEKKKWVCNYCETELSTKFRLQEHTKKCSVKWLLDKNEDMKIFYHSQNLQKSIIKKSLFCDYPEAPLLQIIKDVSSIEYQLNIIDGIFKGDSPQYLLLLKSAEFPVDKYLQDHSKEIYEKLIDFKKNSQEDKLQIYKQLGFEPKENISNLIYLKEKDFEMRGDQLIINNEKLDKQFLIVLFYSEDIGDDKLSDFKQLFNNYRNTYNFAVCNFTYIENISPDNDLPYVYIFTKNKVIPTIEKDLTEGGYLITEKITKFTNFFDEMQNWFYLYQFKV